jgi:pyruvate,orthophosphate dikinase
MTRPSKASPASSGDARFRVGQLSPFHSDVCRCRIGARTHHAFEDALEIAKEDRGYFLDTELQADDLIEVGRRI